MKIKKQLSRYACVSALLLLGYSPVGSAFWWGTAGTTVATSVGSLAAGKMSTLSVALGGSSAVALFNHNINGDNTMIAEVDAVDSKTVRLAVKVEDPGKDVQHYFAFNVNRLGLEDALSTAKEDIKSILQGDEFEVRAVDVSFQEKTRNRHLGYHLALAHNQNAVLGFFPSDLGRQLYGIGKTDNPDQI